MARLVGCVCGGYDGCCETVGFIGALWCVDAVSVGFGDDGCFVGDA